MAKVHRALAWKLAGKVESHFPQDRVAEAAPGHDLQLPIVIYIIYIYIRFITIIYSLSFIMVNNGSRFSRGSQVFVWVPATEVIAASASSANLFEQSVTGRNAICSISF